MNTSIAIALGAFLMGFASFAAEPTNPSGTIEFPSLGVIPALKVYKDLTGAELITDSRVNTVPHHITLLARDIPKDKAVKLLEKALLEQAGIVTTRLDDRRISVTYNDALPIHDVAKVPKNGQGHN
jgi:hypothetical protein